MVNERAAQPGMADLLAQHAPDIAAMEPVVVPDKRSTLSMLSVIVPDRSQESVGIQCHSLSTADWVARQLKEASLERGAAHT